MPDARPEPMHNRLSIAHLLLWMATTGAALVCLQQYKPRPPETIGFASFLSQARTQEELKIEMDKRRQEIWRVWNAQYLIGLSFSPVYGAAAAGAVLAAWRIVTRRFGFPDQPGHWLS